MTDQQIESIYLDIRESFALAIFSETNDIELTNRILVTVDDAVTNNLF